MKRPSTNQFEQQLLFQRSLEQSRLQTQTASFEQERQQRAAQAQATVAAEQAALEAEKEKKIRKPVTLGTLLTSPKGILGNPVLSGTKLGG